MSITPEHLEAYARPSSYATLVWGQRPYDWQCEVMDSLVVDGNRAVVATCNASGKTSFLISRFCIWYADAFPHSVIVTTSASQRQVGQQLYPNFRKCISMFPNAKDWKVRDNNLFWVKAPNGSVIFSFATNEAGRAEGYHIPDLPQGIHRGKEMSEEWREYLKKCGVEELSDDARLLVVIDEAKSVDRAIFEAFERCRASNWLVVSTPSLNPIGPFFDCFGRDREKFRCARTGKLNIWGGMEEYGLIGYDRCPHLVGDPAQMKVINADLRSKGEGDAFVQSMHLGRFPANGATMVFNMGAVDYSMSGMVPQERGKRAFCCDFSGGGDCQPFGMRDGNVSRIIAKWNETDSTKLADRIVSELRKHGYDKGRDEFIGDNGGIGEACNDILERQGIYVRRFKFQGTPRDPGMYENIRAEGYFHLAKAVALRQVVLPDLVELREQLSWHLYDQAENSRKLKIVPKKTMPSSPDIADVIMMLYYDWIPPVEARGSGAFGRGWRAGSESACGGGLFPAVSVTEEWEDPTKISGILF